MMHKITIIIFLLTFMNVYASANVFKVKSVFHQTNESQNLTQDLHNNVQATAVPFTPVLNSITSLSLPQIGVVTAYSTNHSKDLSQVGELHSIVNNNYTHISKTFELNLLEG